jgi:single-strand DNA-binding protein
VAWRTQAEFVTKYFSKGKPILVCGSIQSRNWQDKEGNKRTTIEVIADEVSFVERKSTSEAFASGGMNGDPGPASPPPSYSTSYEAAPKFEEISADDDLPF